MHCQKSFVAVVILASALASPSVLWAAEASYCKEATQIRDFVAASIEENRENLHKLGVASTAAGAGTVLMSHAFAEMAAAAAAESDLLRNQGRGAGSNNSTSVDAEDLLTEVDMQKDLRRLGNRAQELREKASLYREAAEKELKLAGKKTDLSIQHGKRAANYERELAHVERLYEKQRLKLISLKDPQALRTKNLLAMKEADLAERAAAKALTKSELKAARLARLSRMLAVRGGTMMVGGVIITAVPELFMSGSQPDYIKLMEHPDQAVGLAVVKPEEYCKVVRAKPDFMSKATRRLLAELRAGQELKTRTTDEAVKLIQGDHNSLVAAPSDHTRVRGPMNAVQVK